MRLILRLKKMIRIKVTVWNVMSSILLRPYFYGNANGSSYLDISNNFISPQLHKLLNNKFENGRFQRLRWLEDGAPFPRYYASGIKRRAG